MLGTALCPVLIGREEEVARLEDGLVAASRGQGRIVLLAGDAGVGKTRLVTELSRLASRLGFLSLSGGCAETDLALPYLPILEAVGNHLASADLDALRERLGPAGRALAQLFPQLDPIAGEHPSDDSQAKLRLFDAMVTLLRALSGERGLLLAVEDLHWADASTRELLDYLTRRVRTERVLIVGTFRRDEVHRRHPLQPLLQAWRRATLADVIDLDPLPSDCVEAMLDAIFDTDVGADLRDLLFERSEGNPFILEEMLKDAIDRGDLFRSGSGWERRALADLKIPQTVADSILLRVERLDDMHADVVRAAAVLGRTFDTPTLIAVTGYPESGVFDALKACVQQQLLEEDPSGPGRFRFRHALTRESVYDDLIEPERRRLHTRAADVLSDVEGTSASEIAHHLIAAGRTTEAIPYDLRAAEDAVMRFAYKDGSDFYKRALKYIQDEKTRGDVLARLGVCYWRDGSEPESARKYLEEGVAELDRLGETFEAARYRVFLGRVRWETSDPEGAREEYLAALPPLEAAGPSADLAHVYVRLAGLHCFDLEAAECVKLATQARDIADEVHEDWSRLLAGLFIGAGTCLLGEPDVGLKMIDDANAEAERLGYDWVASNGYALACIYRFGFGRAAEVLDVLTEARRILPLGQMYDGTFAFFQGWVFALLGPIDESLRAIDGAFHYMKGVVSLLEAWAWWSFAGSLVETLRFDEALEAIEGHRGQVYREELFWRSTAILRLHNAAGNLQNAAAIADEIFEQVSFVTGFRAIVPEVANAFIAAGRIDDAERFVTETAGEHDRERPWMQLARGRVALARGDADAARSLLSDAVERFGSIGYRIDQGHARVDLARVLGTAGDVDGAGELLSDALSLARECASLLIEKQARDLATSFGVNLHEPIASLTEASATPEPAMRDATEQVVTVLFADVRGYTAMTNREAPADLAERIGAFHRWASREIEQHRGLVDKFAGDACMATFNVVTKTLDHSLHALHAGIALQGRAALAGLPIGVGIATGTAIVGRFAEGANVSILGAATNLSARLQAVAQEGEIVLSEEAYRRVRAWLEDNHLVAEERSFELKGFEGQTTAYVVRPSN